MAKVGRKKKNESEKALTPIAIRLNKGLRIRLETFCKFSGMNRSEVIKRALNEYLEKNTIK